MELQSTFDNLGYITITKDNQHSVRHMYLAYWHNFDDNHYMISSGSMPLPSDCVSMSDHDWLLKYFEAKGFDPVSQANGDIQLRYLRWGQQEYFEEWLRIGAAYLQGSMRFIDEDSEIWGYEFVDGEMRVLHPETTFDNARNPDGSYCTVPHPTESVGWPIDDNETYQRDLQELLEEQSDYLRQ